MIRNASAEVWVGRDRSGTVVMFPTALPPDNADGHWVQKPDDSEEQRVELPYETFRNVFGQPLPKGALVRMMVQTAVMLPDADPNE